MPTRTNYSHKLYFRRNKVVLCLIAQYVLMSHIIHLHNFYSEMIAFIRNNLCVRNNLIRFLCTYEIIF